MTRNRRGKRDTMRKYVCVVAAAATFALRKVSEESPGGMRERACARQKNDEIKKVDKSANFWVVLLLAYRVALDQGFAVLFFWFLATSGRFSNQRASFWPPRVTVMFVSLFPSLPPLNILLIYQTSLSRRSYIDTLL